jgi:hypothetical protein
VSVAERDQWDREEEGRGSRRKRQEDKARHLAAIDGGEWEDILDELNAAGKDFDDSHLTKQGFVLKATYHYHAKTTTVAGVGLYEVLRYEHPLVPGAKRFFQRRFVPPGVWINGAGSLKVVYRWPDLARRTDEPVYFTEGEKDADRLASLGLLATTVAGQNWSPEAVEALRGRDVIVLEDNDDKGRINAANAARRLAGTAGSVRVLRLPGLRRRGDVSDWLDAGHDKAELVALAREAPTHGPRPTPHPFPDERTLAPWQWLYGRHLLRGKVSATTARGGVGKTSLSIGEALAMTAGKDLLGVVGGVPAEPSRVMLINLEDDRNSTDKRIAAAMKRHGLTATDIGDRLFVATRGEMGLVVARQARGAAVKREQEAIDDLVAFLVERKIDVLSVDPVIRTHGVNENDNEAISSVIGCFEEIAERAGCAISLWHHTRKGNGQEVSIDSARGAGSFVDACRSVRLLETMSETEAKKLGLIGGYYFREFSGKRTFAPPEAESTWYQLVGVDLENGGGEWFGDQIGVTVRWQHPGAEAVDLSLESISAIRERVAASRWREDVRAGMWVGKAVAGALGLDAKEDKARINGVIRELKARGVLKEEPGRDEHRKPVIFTVVA